MSNMNCPFCQRELERNDLDVQLFGCENQNCKHSIHYDTVGTKDLWQELIRTRKALDVAKHVLADLHNYAELDGMQSLDVEEALAEIMALEQKDVK